MKGVGRELEVEMCGCADGCADDCADGCADGCAYDCASVGVRMVVCACASVGVWVTGLS